MLLRGGAGAGESWCERGSTGSVLPFLFLPGAADQGGSPKTCLDAAWTLQPGIGVSHALSTKKIEVRLANPLLHWILAWP